MVKRKSSIGKNSRTRSGCFTCRDRHMKCDEQQPVCKNCIKSKRKCYRGVRLNFTQYTIYNPENDSAQPSPSFEHRFRILDQSITIASLYERGRSQYEQYLNLHTPEDLREANIRFQEEMYLSHSVTTDDCQSQSRSLQYNNYRQLQQQLNPTGFTSHTRWESITSSFQKLDTSQKGEIDFIETPIFNATRIDEKVSKLINLIQKEKYYWILDLFNDLKIWEQVIPTNSLRNKNDSFLFDCIVSCCIDIQFPMELIEQQIYYWKSIEFEEFQVERMSIIPISIALILLSILLRVQTPNSMNNFNINTSTESHINPELYNIYYQQIQLFNFFSNKFGFQSGKTSAVFVNSIHSIVILKFLLNQQGGFTSPFNNQEIEFLRFPQGFEIQQESTTTKSDCWKLREYFWDLVKIDYCFKNKDFNTFNIVQSNNEINSTTNSLYSIENWLLANETKLATKIIKQYTKKINYILNINVNVNVNDDEYNNIRKLADTNLESIFAAIANSVAQDDNKAKWKSNFSWVQNEHMYRM